MGWILMLFACVGIGVCVFTVAKWLKSLLLDSIYAAAMFEKSMIDAATCGIPTVNPVDHMALQEVLTCKKQRIKQLEESVASSGKIIADLYTENDKLKMKIEHGKPLKKYEISFEDCDFDAECVDAHKYEIYRSSRDERVLFYTCGEVVADYSHRRVLSIKEL